MVQKKQTTQLLADSFMDLMLQFPFDEISVAQIASNCATSRQTFYKHFSDKYALACWIYREQVLTLPENTADGLNWYEAIIHKLYVIMDNSLFYQKIFKVDWFINAFAQITNSLYRSIICDRLNTDALSSEIEFAIDFFSYEAVRKTAQWVMRGFAETPETLATYFKDCLPSSLKAYILLNANMFSRDAMERVRMRMLNGTFRNQNLVQTK